MSDYQAIYDAVRSRISGGNLGEVLRDVAWQQLDISHSKALICEAFMSVACDMGAPSVLYRPKLSIDGNKWCAFYGDNLQDGVAGFGASPFEAMQDFDKRFKEKLP